MNRTFTYETNCVYEKGTIVQEMVDRAIEITYRTFRKHVSKESINETFPEYINSIPSLKNDYTVRFFRSKYKGEKCYYIVHSAIEYIFT